MFEIEWTTSKLLIIGYSADVKVTHVEFLRIDPKAEGMGLWITSKENDRCIAELVVEASIEAEIEGSIRKNTTDEEVASGESVIEQSCEIKVLLECSGNLVAGELDEWQVDVDVSIGKVILDVGRSPFEKIRPGLHAVNSNGQIFALDLFDEGDIPF